jgi:hypothetical protein
MELLDKKILRSDLEKISVNFFGTFIKAVVDVEKEIMAIDAELHADLESLLLENGSRQENLWGINLYPMKKREDFIEYTAMINIRPHQNNRSMEIENNEIVEKVKKIVNNLIDYNA